MKVNNTIFMHMHVRVHVCVHMYPLVWRSEDNLWNHTQDVRLFEAGSLIGQ